MSSSLILWSMAGNAKPVPLVLLMSVDHYDHPQEITRLLVGLLDSVNQIKQQRQQYEKIHLLSNVFFHTVACHKTFHTT